MKQANKSSRIRIIAGQWRGRRLPVLTHEGLRPTTDRVRETLFNWLMHDLAGARCLDLFAGSGVLGLEALSRGAEHAVFVESDKRVAAQLVSNLRELSAQQRGQVQCMDALVYLRSRPATPLDVVFVDPPYQSQLLEQVIQLLHDNGWLSERAVVYLERSARDALVKVPETWTLHREGRAGQVAYRLYFV
ncbi:ribosomal RNA small subunit methyltransferase D [Arenicella chitinivorans]|uniref:Ribosomal RNA small subunit methyltransferase D n=1 Tax=Arenicella chitinivorans TaxID=1329800 RepID=A0A918RR80_9GAMM|nr:16S rRNA (guanine(966)-N(2))-methyltransferase RsmD [Arenicella chitinivorans]GHA10099.1 ribosomal RNA small subunit methyltransferase D [Arenicella chitinivorans]